LGGPVSQNGIYSSRKHAKVAELVDALDLGSSRLVLWGFDSPLSHTLNAMYATHIVF
jgi:hypothetical protein